jgi:hypothetical protein
MDQLSNDLIIVIYSYNTIDDIKYINKFANNKICYINKNNKLSTFLLITDK